MKILLSSLIFVVFVTISSNYAYAIDYTYPTINQRLTETPTYCAVESISDKISLSQMNEMMDKSQIAVNTWKEKLQDSELINKDFLGYKI